MNSEKIQLPTFRQFLWLFFMQPITLHYRLKAGGIEDPNATLQALWFAPKASRLVKRHYIEYLLGLWFFIMPVVTVIVALFVLGISIYILPEYTIDFEKWSSGVVIGLAIGMASGVAIGMAVGVTVGMAVGVTFSVVGSVALGMAFGVVGGVTGGVSGGVAFGIAVGIAGGVAVGIAGGMTIGVVFGMVFGAAIGVASGISVALGVALGVAVGVAAGVAAGVAVSVGSVAISLKIGVAVFIAISVAVSLCLLFFLFRLPFYPLEALLQIRLYFKQNTSGQVTLHQVPVLYHELSYLPHPWLASHILLNAELDLQLVKRVIAACRIAPGQRRAGEIALAQLQAKELVQDLQHNKFVQIIELTGKWLPSVEGAAAPLLTIRELARYLQAAHTTRLPYHGLQHLQRAQQQYQALENQLLTDLSPLADALKATLPTWHKRILQLRQKTEKLAQQFLPNPFRTGDPLSPESGREVFRGRQELVQQIESLLVDSRQRVSIALLGPRRTGKSSLLKMLPLLLPDTVSIFFDLQDNPIDSPASFFKALAQRAQEQAQRDRRLTLPPLPNGTPFEAGSQWLQQLDNLAIQQRILICLDEFERLENTFPGERQELLQLMGLFRATIQHRQRVRLLVAGVAPFDELDSLWSDHFINLREVRIGYLDKTTALELLTQPIPEFPLQAIPTAVAEAIFTRSGGLPYLLQLYGSLLVEHLNAEKRQQSQLSDLEIVEEQVLEQATYYFRNTVQSAPSEAQAVLLKLAEGDFPVAMDKRTHRWLQRRSLLTAEEQLTIPVLGTWISREYG
jgi:hypothetical protein